MKIVDFFEENQIDLNDKKLLVASSAGSDSMALLDMLWGMQKKCNFAVIAAHFDHQLRVDSEKETEILKKYCRQKEIPFFSTKWLKSQQPQRGVEAAARHARYAFLTMVANEQNADYLLTAHHGDDLLENILLKFIRSGNPEEMNSLQAIGKMHGIKLLRPLLAYSKQELLDYDRTHEISFIIDSTNEEDETMRNRLRHHVVPLLKKENPALLHNALNFSQKMNKLVEMVDDRLTEIGTVEPFLGRAYRISEEKLANLTTDETTIFWQKAIWQKYHRRVNQNLGNFDVQKYQGYFYLFRKNMAKVVEPQTIKVDQEFIFQGRKLVLTTKRKENQKAIGDFWFNTNVNFSAGSLMVGYKLLLQNGQRVKAKKKFAENAIPLSLRALCLTIYVDDEPVFVEQTYQSQKWCKNGCHYYLYDFLKVYKDS